MKTTRITTAEAAAEWLGNDRETPSGEAWRAVQEGSHDKLTRILDKHGKSACQAARGPIGHPVRALSKAARLGDTLSMQKLIYAGADLNARSDGNMMASPLYWAVEAYSLPAVRMLIREGAQVNPENENLARHAVQSADPVLNPHHTVLEALLTAGTEAAPDAVVAAFDRGAPQWAQQLLEAGADPNARDTRPSGEQPLAIVLRRYAPGAAPADPDSTAMRSLRILLDWKVDVNAELGPENMYSRPPLLMAAEGGAAWAIRPLLEAGADPQETVNYLKRYGAQAHDRPTSNSFDAIRKIVTAATSE